MKTTKIYLCGPINGCSDFECQVWRSEMEQMLPSNSFEFINPLRRDYRGMELEHLNEIVVLDKIDIDNSDVVLANSFKPSAGTSMEIFYAYTKGKPIVSIIPTDEPVSPWIKYHSTKTVLSLPSGIKWITNNLIK